MLSEVVAHYSSLRRRTVEMGANLDQAIAFFEIRYRPETEAITILNAKEKFMATRHDIGSTSLQKDLSQIAILSREESKQRLYASMIYRDGGSAAAFAIGLFAGLRPSEIRDLKPQDILNNKIRVTGGKMRRKLNR